ncbi:hypothetical protein BDM02DRAFT_3184541 [Thelephora ganbajun]|uniref:Uncharacterized protein n=1 Tax=Thelephora ganbajun TaxID=370292 RepID=A0ACB6ZQ21_THEGA|nr:hypothetical protein BDM02DRAFT_3184541 [Thelephora ganbajun]
MFKLVSFALVALVAVCVVNSAPIFPRAIPPAGWIAEILEPYDDYHTRYLAIGCKDKHSTQFFDDCCHPMKKGETLEENRKAYCRPGAGPAPSSTPPAMSQPSLNTLVVEPSPTSPPVPESTSVPDHGDDDDGDEDCEEDPVSSPADVPSSTPDPAPTPSKDPEPTSTPSPSPTEPSPTEDPKPSPTPAQNSPSSETHTGGHVTWFTQDGNPGACGDTHSDNDYIAALDFRVYGDLGARSKYCGQKIKVSSGDKSVIVVVADACPSCDNPSSVDLSTAAFQQLASLDVGLLTDGKAPAYRLLYTY